jgi:hypothetical protein
MSWNARTCRGCGLRFEPKRLDARVCHSCESVSGELERLIEYMRSHREEHITRVAAATGVGEDLIRDWARQNRLPHMPPGSEPEPEGCTCDPAGKGRCPSCRAVLAQKLASAVEMTAPIAHGPRTIKSNAGMRTRPR